MTRTGSSPRPARTVFFGSGGFAVPILDALAAMPAIALVGVVTAPDRPSGRSGALAPTAVAVRATELGLPLLRPERVRVPEAVAAIEALEPDLGVLADYGRIVPQAILDLPPHGILNVHPSLLPRHRGATPIPATIAHGDPRTGVSIIRMDAGIDTGPIVAQAAWPLDGTERAPELEATAAVTAPTCSGGRSRTGSRGRDQPSRRTMPRATMTRPFRREDGRLDPRRTAVELERQVRANGPWPGTFIETGEGRLAVLAAAVAPAGVGLADADAPGTLTADGLTTADGLLGLAQVQPAGGKPMSWDAYLRGRPVLIGSAVTGR